MGFFDKINYSMIVKAFKQVWKIAIMQYPAQSAYNMYT